MKRTARVSLRIAEMLLYGFCLLLSYLHGTSGQVGFSITYAALGLVSVWLIGGAPRPRVAVLGVLRAITGRGRPDHRRIAELERQLAHGPASDREASS